MSQSLDKFYDYDVKDRIPNYIFKLQPKKDNFTMYRESPKNTKETKLKKKVKQQI